MNRTETMAIMAILKEAYPYYYKDKSKEELNHTVNLWAEMFASDPAKIVAEAVKALICTLKFPPTIADVKEKIALITQPPEMTEMEAWQMVKSAISYYNAAETYERLPPILKRIVGSPNQLREWAIMETEKFDTVVQSNFMRSYKALAAQERERAMLPESTRQMIKGLSERRMLNETNNI